MTYAKRALGESFVQIQEKVNQRIIEERRMLANLEKKALENRSTIDALKDKISKKEEEKRKKKEIFTEQNKQKKLKSEKRKLKNKMKKIKKS